MEALTPVEPIQVDIVLAGSSKLPELAVASTSSIDVGEDAAVTGALSAASGGTRIGDKSDVGAIVSIGDVSLGKKAVVRGNVTASGEIARASHATIEGQSLAGQSISTRTLGWSPTVPPVDGGSIALVPGQVRDLIPGNYGALEVPAKATIVLHSGVYAFTDVELLSGSTVLVDDADGPVQLFARESIYLRGTIASATSGAPNLLIGYLGTETTKLRAPLDATFIAPNADVVVATCRDDGRDDSCSCDDSKHDGKHGCRHGHGLGLGHRDENRGNGRENRGERRSCEGAAVRGLVYASHVSVEKGARIEARPFDWVSVIGPSAVPSTEGTLPVHMMGESVLEDFRAGQSSANTPDPSTSRSSIDLPTPYRFRLQDEYEVDGGVIANGLVRFLYRNESGATVTCTYRGKSPTSAPQTTLDLNLGRMLRFVSCSDGGTPSVVRTARHIEMEVQGVPNYPVSVGSPTIEDGSCSETFQLITPDETRRLREGFDWAQQPRIAERNPDGNPTLFYAWIYVRNPTEVIALRKLFIHVLNSPLSTEELDRFAGRCGTFSNPGDGEGTFIPVLLPGATFNKLRDAAVATNISGDKTVFDVVRIRGLPPNQRNPNGSLRLDALGRSGFRYLDYETRPLKRANEYVSEAGRARILTDVLSFIGDVPYAIADEIQQVLASVVAAFVGRVGMTLEIHAISRVPEFTGQAAHSSFLADPTIVRAWGPRSGREIGADGMRVDIYQRILFPNPFPALSTGKTNADGTVFIDAVRDADPFQSGICLTLRTDAAVITNFLLPNSICDFRGFGVPPPGVTPAPPPRDDGNYQLSDFSRSRQFHLHIRHKRVTSLYLADDAWRWSHDVVSFRAPRARVLTGPWAWAFSLASPSSIPGLKKPNTICLGQTRYSEPLIQANTNFGFLSPTGSLPGFPYPALAAGLFASVMASTDIILPLESAIGKSRVLMTHEYGHHLFCSLVHEYRPAGIDDPVGHLAFQTIASAPANTFEFLDLDATFDQYLSEAFAEFISGQVSSGATYGWAQLTPGFAWTSGTGTGSYCARGAGTAGDACFDANLRANSPGDGVGTIGRVATLLHDAFDGRPQRAGTMPSNADFWDATSGVGGVRSMPFPRLIPSPMGFANQDTYLAGGGTVQREKVILPGSALKDFAFKLSEGMGQFGTGPGLKEAAMYKAINYAMDRSGVGWCDRCRVFALHSTFANPTPDLLNLLDTCGTDGLIKSTLGPPPEPNLRVDAETCEVCPAGTVPANNGGCVACASPNSIVGNKCALCPADTIRDGSTLTGETIGTGTVAPGDPCPGTFILEIQNPSLVFTRSFGDLTAVLNVLPVPVLFENLCTRAFSLVPDRNGPEPAIETFGVFTNVGIAGPRCTNTPVVIYDRNDLAGVSRLRLSTATDPLRYIELSLGPEQPK